ncbi:MAG: NrfD/PsrC family molybdoenzyme membrane anchor subunit [Candidatus Electryonea clarkiae]|nr:NrfD/PsrC family molybdoenzyme membrane anchor subunit [Candidatus Electryonea clarkiae]
MTEVTSFRNNPLIDPHLEIWEWQIPGYLFLGGLVAGLMILNGVWRLFYSDKEGRSITRNGAVAAPVLLSLGMFLLFLDLSYKIHVFRFYTTFNPASPMSWGSWILLLVYPVQILTLALPGGIERFGWRFSFLNPLWDKIKIYAERYNVAVSTSNIVLGIGLGIYTGILLAVNAARPLWNVSLLGPLFLVSGLSAASAWNLLARPNDAEKKLLVRWDIGLLGIELIFLMLIIIELSTGPIGKQAAAGLFLGGNYTASFWVFIVGLGILLPLWLEIREAIGRYVPHWLGPLLVLGGGLALRIVFVYAGQISSMPEITLFR